MYLRNLVLNENLCVSGLSMTRYKTEGDIKFFRFEHTQDYRSRCLSLVQQLRTFLIGQISHQNNLHSENCVEALLEVVFFIIKQMYIEVSRKMFFNYYMILSGLPQLYLRFYLLVTELLIGICIKQL